LSSDEEIRVSYTSDDAIDEDDDSIHRPPIHLAHLLGDDLSDNDGDEDEDIRSVDEW
jgi:hypothetical protein